MVLLTAAHRLLLSSWTGHLQPRSTLWLQGGTDRPQAHVLKNTYKRIRRVRAGGKAVEGKRAVTTGEGRQAGKENELQVTRPGKEGPCGV